MNHIIHLYEFTIIRIDSFNCKLICYYEYTMKMRLSPFTPISIKGMPIYNIVSDSVYIYVDRIAAHCRAHCRAHCHSHTVRNSALVVAVWYGTDSTVLC
jgi:hypothetical protein